MTNHLLDTGEAFLSADDKCFARVPAIRQHIEREDAFPVAQALTGAVVAMAIAGLTLAALAV